VACERVKPTYVIKTLLPSSYIIDIDVMEINQLSPNILINVF